MYHNRLARPRTARHSALVFAARCAALIGVVLAGVAPLGAQELQPSSVIRRISGRSEKLELTTNTSRILTLEKNIPRVQVNNPELVAVTPLSATDVQISAKKAGVTQVNLWDEDGNVHTIDVLIYGDARELEVALQTQFPNSSIKVFRYSESLVLKGIIDQPEHVTPIMRIAEDYAPKVINNMVVGGAQQVLLKVKVMEVSRTKARRLGVDWEHFSNGGFARSTVSRVTPPFLGTETFRFGIVDGNDQFFGFLDALQREEVAKILAEPNMVAISGRAARFSVGGETPVLVPQSLGTTSIEYKEFGTIVDFVPIVLGNGRIHLEVRPEVSTLDQNLGIDLNEIRVPGFKQRRVHTAVEMNAGQTFVLAGLVEERVETRKRGFPYLSDMPYVGVPFRRTIDEVNEIELLIMVTPEFVDALDPHEVPCGGPGYATVSPTNRDLYCSGHVEVPAHWNPIRGPLACGQDPCGPCADCATCGPAAASGGPYGGHGPIITDGLSLPGGVGYDEAQWPATISDQSLPGVPDDLPLPAEDDAPVAPMRSGASFTPQPAYLGQSAPPHPDSPPRQPVFMRNASRPNNPQPAPTRTTSRQGETGLIGPIGYDMP